MSMQRGLAVACGIAASVAAGCSASPAPVGEQIGTIRAAGSTAFPNDQYAYDYFRAKGFTDFQAAGIVGNLDQESGIDPMISQQNGGPGRGIAQWSAGGRWDSDPGDNLTAFATMQGQSPYSLDLQLAFIMYELDTFPDYGLAKLKASTNVTDATTDFELDFEGCAIPSECDGPSRVNYAMGILAAYGNDPVPDAGGGSGDDGGASDDGGTGNGDDAGSGPASDAGGGPPPDGGKPGSGGGRDAGAPPAPTPDAATSSPSHDAGGGGSPGTGEAAAPIGQSSGCAVAATGAGGEPAAASFVVFGLALGLRRPRRRPKR
jgi:MYXO-CTERM domain-containing protein